MNIANDTMYSRSMTSLRLIALDDFGLLALEHRQHPVGDEEAANDVDRAEDDRDDEQQLVEEAVDRPDQQQAAEHDDPVDRVRAAHERRVQRVRHLRDDLEADERGQHEDRDLGQQIHQITFPSRTTHAPATTSSSKSKPSSTSDRMLRAYSEDACSAISDGRFKGPTILTPPSVVNLSPGRVSSQLPPASAARSTITEPGFMSATADAGMSFGAGRPGTSAVVTITSDLPIWTLNASRWSCCSSGVSSRA